jgi:hypothetical protein
MYECVPGAEKSPNLIDALVFVNHITKYNQNDKNGFPYKFFGILLPKKIGSNEN